MGITIPKNLKKYPKENNPTFIFLARLNKQKGIFDAIEVFNRIKNYNSGIKNARFWIVGLGKKNIVNEIKNLVKKYRLKNDVKFFGFVTEIKKYELLGKAHILLIPSIHEGWGLTVAEAATQKTPSITYNVPGLSDISKQSLSSIILSKNTPLEMANTSVKIIKNKKLYEKLQELGQKQTTKMTWDKTAESALEIIKKTYEKSKTT